MLPFLGAAVAILVFEAAAMLMSTGLCVKHSKLKRRGGKRYKGDFGYGNGYPRTGRQNGVGTASVIFATGIGDEENGYRGDGGDFGRAAGADYGGKCLGLHFEFENCKHSHSFVFKVEHTFRKSVGCYDLIIRV